MKASSRDDVATLVYGLQSKAKEMRKFQVWPPRKKSLQSVREGVAEIMSIVIVTLSQGWVKLILNVL